MIIEVGINDDYLNKRIKEVEKETTEKVLTALRKEIEEHSVHWSYCSRSMLLDRVDKFKETYIRENNI